MRGGGGWMDGVVARVSGLGQGHLKRPDLRRQRCHTQSHTQASIGLHGRGEGEGEREECRDDGYHSSSWEHTCMGPSENVGDAADTTSTRRPRRACTAAAGWLVVKDTSVMSTIWDRHSRGK